MILDLSRGVDGRPQLVTTNFDLLFEAVEKRISRVVPPALPDLSLQQAIEGVVYLHGRLRKPEVGVASGYVISSADFRSEEHTSELQSLMRISYAVFCLKKQKNTTNPQ